MTFILGALPKWTMKINKLIGFPSRKCIGSSPTVNQVLGMPPYTNICICIFINIYVKYLYTSTFQGVPIKPQGMVNCHPFGTIWHPLEGPGIILENYIYMHLLIHDQWYCSKTTKNQGGFERVVEHLSPTPPARFCGRPWYQPNSSSHGTSGKNMRCFGI